MGACLFIFVYMPPLLWVSNHSGVIYPCLDNLPSGLLFACGVLGLALGGDNDLGVMVDDCADLSGDLYRFGERFHEVELYSAKVIKGLVLESVLFNAGELVNKYFSI